MSDDCGRQMTLPRQPQRVISLCPSLTETVAALRGEALVGRTRYCIHPEGLAEVAEIGGTKNPRLDQIRELAPDLIIAEKEENRREDVECLASDIPVFVFDIRDVSQALAAIPRLGRLLNAADAGDRMAADIERCWSMLPRASGVRVVYLIWRKPWMTIGSDTFIDAVLNRLGLDNMSARLGGRYPQVSPEQLRALAPDHVLLSSEPYPFTEKHFGELQRLLPQARVHLVDGEMFSWYGVRMARAAGYFHDWLPALDGTG